MVNGRPTTIRLSSITRSHADQSYKFEGRCLAKGQANTRYKNTRITWSAGVGHGAFSI